MPRRNEPFGTGEIYHVYNRSVGREMIFSSKVQLRKVLEFVNYYIYPQTVRLSKFNRFPDNLKQEYLLGLSKANPHVEIYAYAFMPNHYHFLIRQKQENGIQKFITKIQDGYAKYFNLRYDRHGSLFQTQFKAKRIESDGQFLHISRYIHLNPVTAYLIKFSELFTHPWTSFPYYYKKGSSSFINTQQILSFFPEQTYIEFVANQVDYQRALKEISDLTLE